MRVSLEGLKALYSLLGVTFLVDLFVAGRYAACANLLSSVPVAVLRFGVPVCVRINYLEYVCG